MKEKEDAISSISTNNLAESATDVARLHESAYKHRDPMEKFPFDLSVLRTRKRKRPRNSIRREEFLARKNTLLDASRAVVYEDRTKWKEPADGVFLRLTKPEILLRTHEGLPLALSGHALDEHTQDAIEDLIQRLLGDRQLSTLRNDKRRKNRRSVGFNTAAIWHRDYCAQHAGKEPVESSEYKNPYFREACRQIDHLTSLQIINFMTMRIPEALKFFGTVRIPDGTTRPTIFAPGMLVNEQCQTRWHRDNDPKSAFCVIGAFGAHEGGNLLIRHPIMYNGQRYPGLVLPSGQGRVVIMRSSLLEHSNEPFTGTRHSVVWFVDNGLYKWSTQQGSLHRSQTEEHPE